MGRPMRFAALATLSAGLLAACSGGAPRREVVVYTSHDQLLSQPILDAFETETGIDVLAVYDTEATKTTGLVNRLIAEAGRPQCDVFWNNENVQTLRLVERGLTQPHISPSAAAIPAAFRDPAGHWTGFAARARVIAANTADGATPEAPLTYEAIFDGPDAARCGFALPLFGTTATHFAVIVTERGPGAAEAWLREVTSRGAQVLDSNGQTCDAVARGALRMAWTDTDDAAVAVAEGQPVAALLPREGAIVLPNTVVMIAGAPHPDEARALIDYLLRPETEERLAAGPGAQIPLRPGVPVPRGALRLDEIAVRPVDWPAVAANFDTAAEIASRVLTPQ